MTNVKRLVGLVPEIAFPYEVARPSSRDTYVTEFGKVWASLQHDDSNRYNSKTRTGKAGTWPAPKQRKRR